MASAPKIPSVPNTGPKQDRSVGIRLRCRIERRYGVDTPTGAYGFRTWAVHVLYNGAWPQTRFRRPVCRRLLARALVSMANNEHMEHVRVYPAPAEGLAVAKLIAGESQCKLCGKKLGGNVAPWRWVYGHCCQLAAIKPAESVTTPYVALPLDLTSGALPRCSTRSHAGERQWWGQPWSKRHTAGPSSAAARCGQCMLWVGCYLMACMGWHARGDVFGAVGPWGPRHRGARGQGVRAVHVPYGQAVCTAVGTAVQVTVGVA